MTVTEMVLIALGLEGLAVVYILNQWANTITRSEQWSMLVALTEDALGYAKQNTAAPGSTDYYSHAGGYMALLDRPLLEQFDIDVDDAEGKRKLMALLMAHDTTHTMEIKDD
jgi:hypothetical protein